MIWLHAQVEPFTVSGNILAVAVNINCFSALIKLGQHKLWTSVAAKLLFPSGV